MEVLLVEDDFRDAELLKVSLSRGIDRSCQVTHVNTIDKAVSTVRRRNYDVILLDLTLSDSDGMDTFRNLQSANSAVPIVIISGHDDKSLGLKAVLEGAEDFLVKGDDGVDTIIRAIRYAIERKRAKRQLRQFEQYDQLTGLLTKAEFKAQTARYFAHLKSSGACASIMHLNTIGFRAVSTSVSPESCDKIMQELAERISKAVRQSDIVARVEGDQFLLFLDNLDSERDADVIANKIHEVMLAPFGAESKKFFLGMSIGLAIYPEDGNSIEGLMENAESAVKEAYSEGQSAIRYYRHEFNERSIRRQELSSELGLALKLEQFEIRYQPQIHAVAKTIVSFEALVYWEHPSRGLLRSQEFMEFAERNNMSAEIEQHAIRKIAQQIVAWQYDALPLCPVTIAVSEKYFRSNNFVEDLKQTMRLTQIDPRLLRFAIPERALLPDIQSSVSKIRALRAMGLTIWMSKFGLGFTSLGQLGRFDIDGIIIDQSLVIGLATETGCAIVKTIINLAENFGFSIMAEGVDKEEQFKTLETLGCVFYQGSYFESDFSAEDVVKLFEQERCNSLESTSLNLLH